MKLDPTVMRTMNAQDFRVMEAVERGMKDHALVPLPLVSSIANLRHGGTHKIVSSLLRDKLLSHENHKRGGRVDGYRLTNAGYDVLALHNLKQRGYVVALGHRIGTGKESDIYLAASPKGRQVVLKFHRLGRTSFRNVRKQRDYLTGNGTSNRAHSWLFLSRTSALKEYAFMKALHDVSYPTPVPIAHNRHVVCMSLVRGLPLYQVYPSQLSADQAASLYEQSLELASRLAGHGLVHCDLNEFNLLVDLSGIQALVTSDESDPYVRHCGMSTVASSSRGGYGASTAVGALSKPAWEHSLEAGDRIDEFRSVEPAELLDDGQPKPVVTLIDFPQMISTSHANGQEYYERDVDCLRRFFEQKLQLHIPPDDPAAAAARWEHAAHRADARLDGDLRASGYAADDRHWNEQLELYYFEQGPTPIASAIVEEGDDDEEESDDDREEASSAACSDGDEGHDRGSSLSADGDESVETGSLGEGGSGSEAELRTSVVELDGNDQVDEVSLSLLDTASRRALEERAKARVRKQLEDQKRKSRKQNAFRKRNSNKGYVKGKRVLEQSF